MLPTSVQVSIVQHLAHRLQWRREETQHVLAREASESILLFSPLHGLTASMAAHLMGRRDRFQVVNGGMHFFVLGGY